MIVKLSQLAGLRTIGDGGQGDVLEVDPGLNRIVGYDDAVVVKRYHAHKRPPERAARELIERAAWAQSCVPDDKAALFAAAAWPLAVVTDGPQLWGIVMADMRPHFEAEITLPGGGTKMVLTALQHVLEDDAYLQRCFGVAFNTLARVRVAEAVASSLSVLHGHGIVASDLSHVNVLVALRPPYRATFVDCDSMVFRGSEALTAVQTPGWHMTLQFDESSAAVPADEYKLALAIMRLFARSQSVTGLDDALTAAGGGRRTVRDAVPAALHDTLARALTQADRPSAAEWRSSLEAIGDGGGDELRERWPSEATTGSPDAPGSSAPRLARGAPRDPQTPPPARRPGGHRRPRSAPLPPAGMHPPPPHEPPPPRKPPPPPPPPDPFGWRRGPIPYIVLLLVVVLLAMIITASAKSFDGTASTSLAVPTPVQASPAAGRSHQSQRPRRWTCTAREHARRLRAPPAHPKTSAPGPPAR